MMVKLNSKQDHIGEPKKIRHEAKIAKIGKGAALLLTATLMTSCASFSRDHIKVGSTPDDYRKRHEIVVSENQKVADIIVSSNAKSLSHRDRQVVHSLAYAFKRSGANLVTVQIPSNSANSHAASSLAHQSITELVKNGVSRSMITVEQYDAYGLGDSATLRMTYNDLKASVKNECGKWNEDLMDNSTNKNYGNFGCSTQNNLANMIAHPSDLLGPRGESEIDATRRATVIDNWREEGAGENKSYN